MHVERGVRNRRGSHITMNASYAWHIVDSNRECTFALSGNNPIAAPVTQPIRNSKDDSAIGENPANAGQSLLA